MFLKILPMWLTLSNIKIHARIGCYNWEKCVKRLIIVNLELKHTDDRILDYEDLKVEIEDFIDGRQFNYIEELADQLIPHVEKKFNPEELVLEIRKPNIMKSLHWAKIRKYYCKINDK